VRKKINKRLLVKIVGILFLIIFLFYFIFNSSNIIKQNRGYSMEADKNILKENNMENLMMNMRNFGEEKKEQNDVNNPLSKKDEEDEEEEEDDK